MPTNLAIDDRLIVQAQSAGEHKTKKAAVTAALTEYIQRRQQQKVVALFGTIDYDNSYDVKALRHRKPKRYGTR